MANTEEVISPSGSITVPLGTYSPPRVDVVMKAMAQDVLRITDAISTTASTAIQRPSSGSDGDVLTKVGDRVVWSTPSTSVAMGRPIVFTSLGYNSATHNLRAQTTDVVGINKSLATGTATITTKAAHGLTAGTWIELTAANGWTAPYTGLHKLAAGTSGSTLKFVIEGSTQTIASAAVADKKIVAKWQQLPPIGTLTLDTATDVMVHMPVHQVSLTTGASATGSAYIGVGYRKQGSPHHPTLGAYFIVGGNTVSTDYNGSGVSSYLLRAMPAGTYDLTCWGFCSTGTTAFINGVRFQVMGWAASVGSLTGDEVL